MRRNHGILTTISLLGAVAGCSKPAPPADEAALRALDTAYVDAWLTADADDQEKAVLELFSRDAVIMPGGGLAPEYGIRKLQEFWFPDGSPPTTVTHFTHEIDNVDIAGGLGVVSGRYTLSFTYDSQSVTQTGNYMIVADSKAGAWRIKRMIWNDQPLTEV